MAIAMRLSWAGITPEQYEEARERVGWERDVPEGAIFHAVLFTDEGAQVGDVWESEELFRRFAEQRLMPVIAEMGIESQPQIQIERLHGIFNAQLAAQRVGA